VSLEAAVRRLVADVWNGERDESAHDLVAPECPGVFGTGPAGMLAWHHDRRTSFSDLRYEVVEIVCGDDRAALHWRARGTQNGQFGPIPATGRPVDYHGASFFAFDGQARIREVWSVNELFQVLQQLGVTITPPEASSPSD